MAQSGLGNFQNGLGIIIVIPPYRAIESEFPGLPALSLKLTPWSLTAL